MNFRNGEPGMPQPSKLEQRLQADYLENTLLLERAIDQGKLEDTALTLNIDEQLLVTCICVAFYDRDGEQFEDEPDQVALEATTRAVAFAKLVRQTILYSAKEASSDTGMLYVSEGHSTERIQNAYDFVCEIAEGMDVFTEENPHTSGIIEGFNVKLDPSGSAYDIAVTAGQVALAAAEITNATQSLDEELARLLAE